LASNFQVSVSEVTISTELLLFTTAYFQPWRRQYVERKVGLKSTMLRRFQTWTAKLFGKRKRIYEQNTGCKMANWFADNLFFMNTNYFKLVKHTCVTPRNPYVTLEKNKPFHPSYVKKPRFTPKWIFCLSFVGIYWGLLWFTNFFQKI